MDDKKLKIKFNEILNDIKTIDSKTASLWLEIYENAIYDRTCANLLFEDLMNNVKNDANAHALHGVNLTKYLERMNKSNDQIIKLAELIQKEKEKAEEIKADDMFDLFEKK